MKPITLKEISQEVWLSSGGGPSSYGVCYYMCNFIESKHGIWSKPGTFAEAKQRAINFGEGTAMMNYAKSQNIQKKTQQDYLPLPGNTFDPDRLYRVEVCIKKPSDESTFPNHEIILVTGPAYKVVFFEPNFGFYEVDAPTDDNRVDFEAAVAYLYAPDYNVVNFGYKDVRPLTKSEPLGFTD